MLGRNDANFVQLLKSHPTNNISFFSTRGGRGGILHRKKENLSLDCLFFQPTVNSLTLNSCFKIGFFCFRHSSKKKRVVLFEISACKLWRTPYDLTSTCTLKTILDIWARGDLSTVIGPYPDPSEFQSFHWPDSFYYCSFSGRSASYVNRITLVLSYKVFSKLSLVPELFKRWNGAVSFDYAFIKKIRYC